MKCKQCKKSTNDTMWYDILVDNERQAIGGKASRNKINTAKWLKTRKYFLDKTIQHVSYYHCFNCGHKNIVETITL